MKTVIEMAGQAFETPGTEPAFRNGFWTVTQEELERFAELVRFDEREVCAYKAGIAVLGADRGLANRVDQAIRARGNT